MPQIYPTIWTFLVALTLIILITVSLIGNSQFSQHQNDQANSNQLKKWQW